MLHPALVPGVPGGGQLRQAHDLAAQARPLVLVLHRDEDLAAVSGQVRTIRNDGRVARAVASRRSPGQAGQQHGMGHPLGERAEQGGAHHPAVAGPLTLQQGGEDPAVGVHPAGDVGDADAHLGGLGGRAGHRQHPRLGLHQQVVGLAVGVGAVVPVAAELAGDQPRVTGRQRVGVQPEPGDRGRGKIADPHVGTADERVQRFPSAGRLQVQHHRLLGPVEPDEPAGHAVTGGVVVVPGEVAPAGALDLDHPRPEVGELPGGERRGHRLFQRHHQYSVQWPGGAALRPAGAAGAHGDPAFARDPGLPMIPALTAIRSSRPRPTRV